MKGGSARAILITVYGNRAYDDTFAELQDILQNAGFSCIAAIAAIAEHSIMHQFAAAFDTGFSGLGFDRNSVIFPVRPVSGQVQMGRELFGFYFAAIKRTNFFYNRTFERHTFEKHAPLSQIKAKAVQRWRER